MNANGPGNGKCDKCESGGSSDANLHEVSLSLDTILSLLAHHQRRDLLRYLMETPDQARSLEECVHHLTEREAERTGERPPQDQVETALHHSHIPKLRDAGVCEYDPRTQDLRYWGNDTLEAWLNRIEAHEADP